MAMPQESLQFMLQSGLRWRYVLVETFLIGVHFGLIACQ